MSVGSVGNRLSFGLRKFIGMFGFASAIFQANKIKIHTSPFNALRTKKHTIRVSEGGKLNQRQARKRIRQGGNAVRLNQRRKG